MNACAEPYGVSRRAGASRRCRPWYSAACESRRPGATARSSQARQRRKRLRHGVPPRLTQESLTGNHGSKPRCPPRILEQRTEEHHLYHVNLPQIPLLSRVKIRYRGKRL